jgi:hypothetical protein
MDRVCQFQYRTRFRTRLMNSAILFKIGIILMMFCFISCSSLPKGSFGHDIPTAPDYQDPSNWAAMPNRIDSADAVPIAAWKDIQRDAPIDVFFIHPTTYTGKAGHTDWNASIEDEKLNEQTDESTIYYQASIFNGAGKIYAPRYRQSHLNCFFTDKKTDAAKSLELAYMDVRDAFEYYLEHFNHGRPFIIASHSQGTFHAKKLIQEYVDGTPLQNKLVVAYLAGLPVTDDYFKAIKPCVTKDETGCFCSWRTFKEGYLPKKLHFPDSNIVVTNPVTWDASIPVSTQDQHIGAILKNFNKLYPELVKTSIYKDLLWVNKPKFPGSFLVTTKNYHVGDYNFFYADIRQNAQDRVKAYLGKD